MQSHFEALGVRTSVYELAGDREDVGDTVTPITQGY